MISPDFACRYENATPGSDSKRWMVETSFRRRGMGLLAQVGDVTSSSTWSSSGCVRPDMPVGAAEGLRSLKRTCGRSGRGPRRWPAAAPRRPSARGSRMYSSADERACTRRGTSGRLVFRLREVGGDPRFRRVVAQRDVEADVDLVLFGGLRDARVPSRGSRSRGCASVEAGSRGSARRPSWTRAHPTPVRSRGTCPASRRRGRAASAR